MSVEAPVVHTVEEMRAYVRARRAAGPNPLGGGSAPPARPIGSSPHP